LVSIDSMAPIAAIILLKSYFKYLTKLEIAEKIGYITTDNTTNHDCALAELGKMLEKRSIVFNPETSRIRCFGHVINRVVKGFLRGSH